MTDTHPVNLRLAEDEYQAIKELAEEEDRSIANYARRVIVAHLEEKAR